MNNASWKSSGILRLAVLGFLTRDLSMRVCVCRSAADEDARATSVVLAAAQHQQHLPQQRLPAAAGRHRQGLAGPPR